VKVVEMDGPGGGWRVLIPETRKERMRGLRGHPPPGHREAMLFLECRSVQTFGMKEPISVVFLDGEMRVLGVRHCRPAGWSWPGDAPVTFSRRTSERSSGSGTASAQRTKQGGDDESPERRGGHDEQGHDPGRPSRKRDRLTARSVGLDEAEPLQHHPEITMRHTTGFG
jgi:hypothetical protein